MGRPVASWGDPSFLTAVTALASVSVGPFDGWTDGWAQSKRQLVVIARPR